MTSTPSLCAYLLPVPTGESAIGESYRGSWVPALDARINDRKDSPLAKLAAQMFSSPPAKINLKGIPVGNGLMDQIVHRRGLFEMGCARPGAILNDTHCQAVMEVGPQCEALQVACRAIGFKKAVCDVSDSVCAAAGWHLIQQTPWNPYDIRVNCTAEPEKCKITPPGLVEWLDSEEVRRELGIDAAGGKLHPISDQMATDFEANGSVDYPSH